LKYQGLPAKSSMHTGLANLINHELAEAFWDASIAAIPAY
jgi:hypothetical protein